MPRKEDIQDALPGAQPDDGLPDEQGAATRDWEELEGADLLTAGAPESGDPRPRHRSGEEPEEDDDNPYQESDAAVTQDDEERALSRDPSREGSRFDEV